MRSLFYCRLWSISPVAAMELGNQTSLTKFILLGFGTVSKLQSLLFLLFLVIYLVTMAGNLLIMALVVSDQHLHTPMYFFLGNLSCLESCYSSTILPSMLVSLVTGDRTVSVGSCIIQCYFIGFLAATECYLLAAMSYDRYLAISKPLHYATRMSSRFCIQLAAESWFCGLLASSIVMGMFYANGLQFTFGGPNDIDHFFCEFKQIINLYLNVIYQMEFVITIVAALLTLPPFVLTVTSYVCIISTILRIPSATGRQKAFSTCSAHLIVVSIFYGTLSIVYLLPQTRTLRDLSKVFSLFYTVVTPMANPFIYTLRNTEVKGTLRKKFSQCREVTIPQKGHCISRKIKP
ncbi:olfactory receptor 6F1-like [Pelodiscus sinensis]|uniref:olfactory receptor 6F1-like n=1 Tax=Pelodiscus sinensis TaxID=13735 RepID=UPI003F6CA2CF